MKLDGKIKRVFLIVLDSVGIGEAPDSDMFGDVGSNTLKSAWRTGQLDAKNMLSIGLGNIDGLDYLGGVENFSGVFARMQERSQGKDTTVGHWEIAGHISKNPLPTFPDGFPEDMLDIIRKISGREVLCNKTYSGTAVINDYGKEAVESGALIVYTSADSVLQIAAHVDTVPLDELYRICSELRERFTDEKYGVGRIIARPFTNSENGFNRTSDRRDYSLKPPAVLLPEAIKNSGLSSIAVGKISDIFANVGFSESVRSHGNREGMELTEKYIDADFEGLCFVNLVDFDMLWGHRRDADAYARGLSEFDTWLGAILPRLKDNDLLIVTADHGCDPSFYKTTDHTREYTPFLAYSKNIVPENFGTRSSFADIAATVAALFGIDFACDGEAMELKFN